MNKSFPTSGPVSPPNALRRKWLLFVTVLLTWMGLSGCASQSEVVRLIEPKLPQLSPPPPELMEKREPNLRQRLLQLSSTLPTTAMLPSDN